MPVPDSQQGSKANAAASGNGGSGEESRRFRELAEFPEANPSPVLRCDDSGRILYQNPAAKRFAGRAGFPEKNISDFLPADFSAKVSRLIDERRTVIDEEWKSLGRILSLTYQPIADTSEIFVFVVDVTEHVNAVQQCRSYATELEAINQQLRNTQAELVQSEKMALLGNLAAGIAHEINSPLGAMSSNNQTVAISATKIGRILQERLADFDPQEAKTLERFIHVITNLSEANSAGIERIRKIVNSMKSFARLDQSEEDYFDIHAGIETTLTLLDHELKRKAEIHREFAEVPLVYCKPREINQVFMNLLLNAAQAIERAGSIRIKTRASEDSVIIDIADTGKGIHPDNLRNIFDPGFTVQGARTGMGLGLPIAYRIIQDHRGLITVRSELGRGSTFTVKLPVHRVPRKH